MNKKRASITLMITAFALGSILRPFNYIPSFAQSECQTFKETGKMGVRAVSCVLAEPRGSGPTGLSHQR
jgi:hypothetical protein